MRLAVCRRRRTGVKRHCPHRPSRNVPLLFSLLLNFRHSCLMSALAYFKYERILSSPLMILVNKRSFEYSGSFILNLLFACTCMCAHTQLSHLRSINLSASLYLMSQCAFLVKFLLSVSSVHHYRLPSHPRRDISFVCKGRSQVISARWMTRDRPAPASEDIVIYLEYILSY